MAKHEFQTNLVGRRVLVTMGLPPDDRDRLLAASDPNSRWPIWAHVGEEAEVVGAYLNNERDPCLLLKWWDGQILDTYAKHVAVIS